MLLYYFISLLKSHQIVYVRIFKCNSIDNCDFHHEFLLGTVIDLMGQLET